MQDAPSAGRARRCRPLNSFTADFKGSTHPLYGTPFLFFLYFFSFIAMSTSSYRFVLAKTSQQVQAYFALRHSIFVEEQGLFVHSDRDEQDAIAYPIIAVEPANQQVVGVVRIYEAEPGLWYGGRLGVHHDYRRGWQIGKGLIYKAVTTANGWGCHQFLATVQLQNVRFFRRLHWVSQEEILIRDRPHHLMEAELEHYPPSNEARPPVYGVEAS
jgi:putative N-acetyltransferase (TIGR04045 family)